MKTDDELWRLIEKYLKEGLEELWDELTPEERRRVFPNLILEVVEANY